MLTVAYENVWVHGHRSSASCQRCRWFHRKSATKQIIRKVHKQKKETPDRKRCEFTPILFTLNMYCRGRRKSHNDAREYKFKCFWSAAQLMRQQKLTQCGAWGHDWDRNDLKNHQITFEMSSTEAYVRFLYQIVFERNLAAVQSVRL